MGTWEHPNDAMPNVNFLLHHWEGYMYIYRIIFLGRLVGRPLTLYFIANGLRVIFIEAMVPSQVFYT